MEASEIAASLTEAQKRWLTDKAEFRKPRPWAAEQWMISPPPITLRALDRLGLVDYIGALNARGLAVRSHLLKESGE